MERSDGAILDSERSKFGGKIGGYEIALSVKVADGAMGADKSEVTASYQRLSGKSEYVGLLLGSGLVWLVHVRDDQ